MLAVIAGLITRDDSFDLLRLSMSSDSGDGHLIQVTDWDSASACSTSASTSASSADSSRPEWFGDDVRRYRIWFLELFGYNGRRKSHAPTLNTKAALISSALNDIDFIMKFSQHSLLSDSSNDRARNLTPRVVFDCHSSRS